MKLKFKEWLPILYSNHVNMKQSSKEFPSILSLNLWRSQSVNKIFLQAYELGSRIGITFIGTESQVRYSF